MGKKNEKNLSNYLVSLTKDIQKCLAFYGEILECEIKEHNRRYAICFGNQKINIYQHCCGTLGFCLLVKGDIKNIKRKLESKGAKIEMGIVKRTGAAAKLDSIYLKDHDGNLVEIAVEKE